MWAALLAHTYTCHQCTMKPPKIKGKFHGTYNLINHGLPLLFTSPLAIHTSDLGPWWSSGEQVECCVWLYSSVVLDEDFCCLLTIILVSFKPCMAHSLVYFTPFPSSNILKVIPLPTIWPAPPTHCWAAWYYHP